MEKLETIAIIGTGNYGIAIGKRLLKYGCFRVVFGSRNPNPVYINACFNTVNEVKSQNDALFSVTSINEAWNKSNKIVFLATSSRDPIYESVLESIFRNSQLSDKIIIDISNQSEDIGTITLSNAERLNNLVQKKLNDFSLKNVKINVVKAFNLINAYAMSADDIKGNIELIPIASDDFESKQYVTKLCNKIGYQTSDLGGLKKSLDLEMVNRTTFSEWYFPSIITMLFVLFNFIWVFMWYFWFPKKTITFEKYLNDFSLMSHLNKVLGFSSLQILAFVYMGSVFASIYQLKNGTKYKLFPKYLDFWLRTRKQFGLWSFLIASFHVLMTIFITNPSYLPDWYRKINNFTAANRYGLSIMTLNGELSIIFGILSYLIMLLVALSSINSIAKSLNWSEWQFVQSKLGLSCLSVGLLHGTVMYVRIYLEKDECSYSTLYLLTRVKLIALYFPLLVLIMRFMFAYFKPISSRIEKIRDGTIILSERTKKSD